MTIKFDLSEGTPEEAAKVLDMVAPGWHKNINLKTFNFHSSCGCVLGQLYGGYGDGKAALARVGVNVDDSLNPFNNPEYDKRGYAVRWRNEIRKRKGYKVLAVRA